jgi:hypothetical protein
VSRPPASYADVPYEERARLFDDRRVIEAAETGAATLGICCPYEVSRFEDAVKATGNEGRLDVRDIAELIDQAISGGR